MRRQVQLSTTHNVSIALPSALTASPPAAATQKILALIEDEESRYQTSLNDTYAEMGEKTFKGLRRALPLTRQKIEWDRVSYLELFLQTTPYVARHFPGSWL